MTISNHEAKALWDFLSVQQEPKEADAIFLFGTQDEKSPDRAAELYHQGFAPKVLVSGGYGPFTQNKYKQPEAVVFGAKLEKLGVPCEHIILETTASNTGENIELGMKILAQHEIKITTVLLVSRPYMMKRIVATFSRQFPEIQTISCPSTNSFDEYVTWMDEKTPGRAAVRLAAEIDRLITYPGRGFITKQVIPDYIREITSRI